MSITSHETLLDGRVDKTVDNGESEANSPSSDDILERVGAEVETTPGQSQRPNNNAGNPHHKERRRIPAKIANKVDGQPDRKGDGLQRVGRRHRIIVSVAGTIAVHQH